MMKFYEKLMKDCLKLAKKGEGQVSPNPLVGAIVLDKNEKIAGKGFHQKFGENHAEVNALLAAGDRAFGGTIIVNLEPCSHYGKTPPCSKAIINAGIKKLIVGIKDVNPKIAGNGIKECQQAGIEVIEGVLENECQEINEIFIENMKKNTPFIAIKTASTIDGKIATSTGSSKWITSEKARKEVHKLRNKYDGILTGSKTVIIDNPSMTCRLKTGRNPARIIIDSNLKTSFDSKIYNKDGTKIFLAIGEHVATHKIPSHVKAIKCPLVNEKIELKFLINELYKQGLKSILVEAGGELNGAFLKQKLVNKIYNFIAPKILGDKNAKNIIEGFSPDSIHECLHLNIEKIKHFNPDILIEYSLKNI
jgi:diaminohydroxyphosphoribosylaminopyrimidine deaminase / 5-amino-6-(5-phosphoribosylamino)uracil reductase